MNNLVELSKLSRALAQFSRPPQLRPTGSLGSNAFSAGWRHSSAVTAVAFWRPKADVTRSRLRSACDPRRRQAEAGCATP